MAIGASGLSSVSIAVYMEASDTAALKVKKIETEVTPPGRVASKVVSILEAFANDCAHEVYSRHAKVVTFRLKCQPRGPSTILSSDEKLVKIFTDNAAKYDKVEGNVPRSVEVECTIGAQSLHGRLTGSLRFPHMLKYFFEQLERERTADTTKICIVGPGMCEDRNGVPSSPQFVEILALFPKAQFLLLDNDQEVLKSMNKFFKRHKTAMYDPTMLMTRTTPARPEYMCPESYLKTFTAVKQFFVTHAHKQDPASMEAMLFKQVIPPNKFYVNVPSEKIEVRDFDINATQFQATDKGVYDVVVATMSIGNALIPHQLDAGRIIVTMVKFLDVLKENGRLVIDKGLYHYAVAQVWPVLQCFVPYNLDVKEIPYHDFKPSDAGVLIPQICTFTQESIAMKNPFKSVGTSSLIVITRGTQKV